MKITDLRSNLTQIIDPQMILIENYETQTTTKPLDKQMKQSNKQLNLIIRSKLRKTTDKYNSNMLYTTDSKSNTKNGKWHLLSPQQNRGVSLTACL